MANEIVTYRTTNGPFRSISDLDNIKGTGEKHRETLKDLGVVRYGTEWWRSRRVRNRELGQ